MFGDFDSKKFKEYAPVIYSIIIVCNMFMMTRSPCDYYEQSCWFDMVFRLFLFFSVVGWGLHLYQWFVPSCPKEEVEGGDEDEVIEE